MKVNEFVNMCLFESTSIPLQNPKHQWHPPKVGSEERLEMPNNVFLDQKNKKYPYMEFDRNKRKWVISKKGLLSQLRLQALRKDEKIKKKQQILLQKIQNES